MGQMSGVLAPIQGFATKVSVASAINTEITTTTATNIITYNNGAQIQGLIAWLTLDVITAATTVTASITWTNPNTGQQTYTWENAASISVGTRVELPVSILVSANSTVTITITAGTANQVFATAGLDKMV